MKTVRKTWGCPLTKNNSNWCHSICEPKLGKGVCGRDAPHAIMGRTQRAILKEKNRKAKMKEYTLSPKEKIIFNIVESASVHAGCSVDVLVQNLVWQEDHIKEIVGHLLARKVLYATKYESALILRTTQKENLSPQFAVLSKKELDKIKPIQIDDLDFPVFYIPPVNGVFIPTFNPAYR